MAGMAEDQAAVLLRPDTLDRVDHILVRFDFDDKDVKARCRTVLLVAEDPKGYVPVHGVPVPLGYAIDDRINRVLVRPVGWAVSNTTLPVPIHCLLRLSGPAHYWFLAGAFGVITELVSRPLRGRLCSAGQYLGKIQDLDTRLLGYRTQVAL